MNNYITIKDQQTVIYFQIGEDPDTVQTFAVSIERDHLRISSLTALHGLLIRHPENNTVLIWENEETVL